MVLISVYSLINHGVSITVIGSLSWNLNYYQGCTLTAPGRLRRPTFALGRLKKNTGRRLGTHPSCLPFSAAVKRVTDFGRLQAFLGQKYAFAQHAFYIFQAHLFRMN